MSFTGKVSSAHRTHADQHDLLWLDNGDLVVSNDGGVFRWDDSGVSDLSAGLQITQAYALDLHPTQPGQLVLGSQDNGTSLQTPLHQARVLDGDGFDCFFSGNTTDTLYASAYYGLLYRSVNGGRTMSQVANYFGGTGSVNEVGAWHTPFQPHPAVPGRIVVAKKSLHHSDDGGETWTSWSGTGEVRSTALALSSSDPEVALLAKNHTLYARQGAEGFFQVEGLPGLHIGDVSYAQDASNQEWWVAFAGYASGTKVWRTLDGGTTWNNVSAGLPNLPIHCLLKHTDGTWLCGSDLGVHMWSEASQTWTVFGAGLPLTPVTDLEEDTTLNRIVAGTYGRGAWAAQWPSAPQWAVVPLDLDASPAQCQNIVSGRLLLHNAGQVNVTECALEVTLSQGPDQYTHWENVILPQPMQPGASAATPDLSFSSPFLGQVEVSIQVHAPNGAPTGTPWTSRVWASGLTETTVLTWWGDCENEDMRWDLTAQGDNNELALASTPLASGDTLVTTWCLPEGCYTLTWNDQGGDGFSGDYCQGAGGFRLQSGSGELHHVSEGQDFGDTFSASFCTGGSICHADYNGDGVRNVDDFLVLLADFGCTEVCVADNSNDGVVNVIDVMNFLTLYSLDCPADCARSLEAYFRAMEHFTVKHPVELIEALMSEVGYSTRTRARNALKRGEILVNGKTAFKGNDVLEPDTKVSILSKDDVEKKARTGGTGRKPKAAHTTSVLRAPFPVVYEDENIFVYEKPANWVCASPNPKVKTTYTAVKASWRTRRKRRWMSTSSTSCPARLVDSSWLPNRGNGVTTFRNTGGVLPKACTSWWRGILPPTTPSCCAPRTEIPTSWNTAQCGPQTASRC